MVIYPGAHVHETAICIPKGFTASTCHRELLLESLVMNQRLIHLILYTSNKECVKVNPIVRRTVTLVQR